MAAIQSQNTSSSTSAPIQNENGVDKFRVGLTKTEASSNEVLNSLFTKYNTDGDETISQLEFDAYTKETSNQQQQDITSASGKRTAVGGIYTVQKGDTLSKIAQDFNISVLELYENNKSIIGNDANKINIGQKLQITNKTAETNNISTTSEDSLAPSDEFDKMQILGFEKVKKMAQELGIDLKDIDSIDELKTRLQSLPMEAKKQIYDTLMNKFVDMTQVDTKLVNLEIDEIAEKLGIPKKEWENASPDEKGKILAEAYNNHLTTALNKDDENSLYNQELARLKSNGPTERERQLYKNIDFNNLSEEDYEKLAKASVLQKHQATAAAIATTKLSKGENQNYIITANAFMLSMLNDSNISNSFSLITQMTGGFTKAEVEDFYNTYAKTYVHTDETDKEFESLALTQAMKYADETNIQTLYQNNSQIIDTLNDAAKQVLSTTTDETRKAMLNNIVENSASIVQGNNSGSQNTSTNRSVVGQPVSNPIQQNVAQTNYISDLRQASQAYQAQITDDRNAIPQEYSSTFKTMQEYRDFKGTGMTMAEYQRAKSALKNNFTSVMNTMIENYANIPDKFKPRILSFFDSMDNNTSGELYLGANDKVRAFMDKYNYMTNEKLLTYVENHPAEVNEAPRTVQKMIEDLQAQENK